MVKEIRRLMNASPFRVVLPYLAVGVVYIYASDFLLRTLVKNEELEEQIEVYKGIIFVLITAVLLFMLIRKNIRTIAASYQQQIDQERSHSAEIAASNELISQKDTLLVASNNRLKAASDMAKLGYWTNDLATNTIQWSDELYKIFELEPGVFELTLPNIIEHFHPSDREQFSDDIERLFRDDVASEHECRIITGSGNIKWVLERLRLVRNDKGEPVRLEGIAVDITKRINDARNLRETNERLKLVMKATVEAIIDWDIVHDEVTWGDGIKDLFGYDLSVYDNYLWSSNIHPDDKERVLTELQQVLGDPKREHFYAEFRFLKADRTVAYVQHRAIFLRDASGNAVRGIAAMIDVTESMQRVREIERQNKALKEIAWIQSHVVRAPLASLMGLAELLRLGEHIPPDQQELIDGILASAGKLDGVIREIVARSETINRDIGNERSPEA